MSSFSTHYTNELVEKFRAYLISNSVSKNTLKNYVSDLRIYFSFLLSRQFSIDSTALTALFSPAHITEFESFLNLTNPTATVKRRLSSLRKFIEYALSQQLITEKVIDLSSPPPATPTPPSPLPLHTSFSPPPPPPASFFYTPPPPPQMFSSTTSVPDTLETSPSPVPPEKLDLPHPVPDPSSPIVQSDDSLPSSHPPLSDLIRLLPEISSPSSSPPSPFLNILIPALSFLLAFAAAYFLFSSPKYDQFASKYINLHNIRLK